MSKNTDHEALTWQAYLQSINDTLAALPSTTLQEAGNDMSALQADSYKRLYADAVKTAAYPLYRYNPQLIGGYGEQCADTDGMAAVRAIAGDFADYREIATQEKERRDARIAELEADVAAWQDRLARESRGWLTRVRQLEAERDALRTELAQRMAIPARALRQ